jgi:hypothetical protein
MDYKVLKEKLFSIAKNNVINEDLNNSFHHVISYLSLSEKYINGDIMNKREEMLDELRNGICRVSFTKVSGESRVMFCTINEEYVPKESVVYPLLDKNDLTITKKRQKTINENVINVWDVENKGWRSFCIDKVQSFTIVE